MSLPMLPPGMGLSLPPEADLLTPFPPTSWDQMVQPPDDPRRLGIVDPQRAMSVTKDDILNQIQERRQESARARKALEFDWRRYEDLYHLRARDPEKQDWQADLNIPEVYNKIQVAVSLIQGALSGPQQFFKLVKDTQTYDDAHVRFIEKWMNMAQQRAGLLDGLLSMWKEAFLLGSGVLKVVIDDDVVRRPGIEMQQVYSDPQQAFMAAQMGMPTVRPVVTAGSDLQQKLSVSHVPLWNIYPDPWASDFYSGKYVIEEFESDEEDMAERVAAGQYDSIDDIGEPARQPDEGYSRWQRAELSGSRSDNRRRHLIQEYTGNLYDREGKIVAENWIVTVANEKAILRIGPNPLWSGRNRYIFSTPIPFQGRVWGRSMIQADAEIQEEMSEFLNLMIDDSKYSALGAFQIDESLSDEPTEVDSIEPGKVYRGRGEFLRKLQFQTTVNQLWPVLNYLQGIGDKSTQISEFVDGTPSSRGRPTATEVQSKTSAGTEYIHNLSMRLEKNDLERALRLVYEHLLQFGANGGEPDLDDLLQEYGGPQIIADPVYRFQLLDIPFRIQVHGISMLADRQNIVSRLMQVVQLSQSIGVPPPNNLNILYTLISSLGFMPEQLGYPSDPEEMAMMLQPPMGGGAPGPGGLGQPPAPAAAPSGGAPPPPETTMNQMMAQGQAG